jgi:hypothetical protein
MVGGFGRRAESGARRRLSGGGRGRNHSGELAARADQQARAGATGGPKGVGSSTCWRGKAGGGGVHREASMADGGGSAPARGRTGRLYSRAQGGEGGFLACQGNQVKVWVVAWPEYGAKGAAATCGVYAGARLVGRRGASTAAHGCEARGAKVGQERRFHGAWTGGSSAASAFGPEGVGRSERARRGATRRRAGRRSGSKPF